MPASNGSSTRPQSRICQHRSACADHHWYPRLHAKRAASLAGNPVIERRSWLQVQREALPVLLARHHAKHDERDDQLSVTARPHARCRGLTRADEAAVVAEPCELAASVAISWPRPPESLRVPAKASPTSGSSGKLRNCAARPEPTQGSSQRGSGPAAPEGPPRRRPPFSGGLRSLAVPQGFRACCPMTTKIARPVPLTCDEESSLSIYGGPGAPF